MIPSFRRGFATALVTIAACTASAQETSQNRVGAHTDWNVFVDSDPTQCWIVSVPEKVENTRDGRAVSVNRGEIMMFVTYEPNRGSSPVISLTGGYPYADGSSVSVAIGDTTYEFFTLTDDDPATAWKDDEFAWPDESEDAKILLSMKRGTTAVVSARSARGTRTKDTFSLFGFTAALEDAEKRCSS